MKRIIPSFLLAALPLVCTASASPLVTFQATADLTPVDITGAPGTTVGIGYEIANLTNDYLVISNSFFCEPGENPLTSVCAPVFGTYNDLIANNGTIIAPNTTVTVDYTPGIGLATIQFNQTPVAGQDAGLSVLTYDSFDGDPTTGDAFQVGFDATTAAPVTLAFTSAPEPGTLALGLAGLAGVWTLRRRRRV